MDNFKEKKWLKTSLLIFLFLLIGFYSFSKTKNLIYGSKIIFKNINDGQIFTDSLVQIEGIAKNSKFVSLNDREIFIDQNGNFKENLILLPGYNIISFKIIDRFGKNKEKELKLYLQKQ